MADTQEPTVDFSDTRAGQFFVLDGQRIHEDDLTPADRARVGLDPTPEAPRADSSEDLNSDV